MKAYIYFNSSKSIRFQRIIIIFLIALIFYGCGGADKQIQRGKQLMEQGNYAEAVLWFSEAIQKDESNAEAHYQLGRAYALMKHYNEAVTEFQIALSFEPDRADISYELGKSLWRLGRRKPALGVFREILQGEAKPEQFEEILTLTGEIHPTRRLTDSNHGSVAPVFSPDGKKIVFVRTFGRADNKIMLIDVDGKNEVNLSAQAGYSDSNPIFSPDSAKIVFSSRKSKPQKEDINNAAIFEMDIDGRNRRVLYETNADILSPNFSPDGETIIFEEYTPDDWEIIAVDADGKNRRQLTDNRSPDIRGRFSPDGKQIVFVSNRDGNYEIYLMKSDGRDQTRLTHNEAIDWMPAFSPDGARIVFVSDRDSNEEVYMMNVDGSKQRRLTYYDNKDITPYFSPDGAKVVFASIRDSSYLQIRIMDLTKTLTRKELLARIRKQIRR